ncbi:CHAD domain-containing protein [Falsiroseomonas sp. HW251]|uniref:CHAD domain-containing protein n=1 Tax=Falsiroseomonas sp. HW251 TaxID=3390998 RepID=UPI003D31F6D8
MLELEAALPPAAADALLRSAPFADRREGRSRRGAAVGLTWLDTADGALAARGLALEQPRRGPRRLLRTHPEPGRPWCPGTPAACLATLGAHDVPEAAGEAPLLPLAGFAGSLTRLALGDGVEATLLRGKLRAVTRESPAARLTLRGPPGAVLATIEALAETAPLLPPRMALPEEARALARDEAAVPRRQGPPHLDPGLDVEQALLLAIGHLTEVMLWQAPIAHAGARTEGVHQMRVAIRRLRSVLRVFRPACDGDALRALDAAAKGVADALGPARDWDVFLGGLGAETAAALPEEPRLLALLRAARRRRESAYAALRPVLDGPLLRRVAWQAAALGEARPWRDGEEDAAALRAAPLPDFAAGVLDKRWKRVTGHGVAIAGLPDEEFHQLRIEAKRLRYAAELFAPLWPRRRTKRFLKRLGAVQDAFGLANDAVVARALMATLADGQPALAWAGGLAEGWSLARARRARRKAASAWEELIAEGIFWNQG